MMKMWLWCRRWTDNEKWERINLSREIGEDKTFHTPTDAISADDVYEWLPEGVDPNPKLVQEVCYIQKSDKMIPPPVPDGYVAMEPVKPILVAEGQWMHKFQYGMVIIP